METTNQQTKGDLLNRNKLMRRPGLDDILDKIDWDVYEQISRLSEQGYQRSLFGKDPSSDEIDKESEFKNFTAYLLRQTIEIPKEERSSYIENAFDLFEILSGYQDKVFTNNFFEYLNEKTNGTEDEDKKKDLVYIADSVYNSVAFTLVDRTESDEDFKDIISPLIIPESYFIKHLGCGEEEYRAIKERLETRNSISIEDEEFFKIRTVSECMEFIADLKTKYKEE